jgi:hypothetical protein
MQHHRVNGHDLAYIEVGAGRSRAVLRRRARGVTRPLLPTLRYGKHQRMSGSVSKRTTKTWKPIGWVSWLCAR